jgi:hypothetical protein
MASPIKICENGNNVCNTSRLRVSTCSAYKDSFNVRNITLEKITATATYPYKNLEAGYEETFAVDDRNENQLFVCARAHNVHLENCQMSTVPGLALSDIAAHVRSDYSSEAVQDVGYLTVQLLDVSREMLYLQAVLILGGLYYLT